MAITKGTTLTDLTSRVCNASVLREDEPSFYPLGQNTRLAFAFAKEPLHVFLSELHSKCEKDLLVQHEDVRSSTKHPNPAKITTNQKQASDGEKNEPQASKVSRLS